MSTIYPCRCEVERVANYVGVKDNEFHKSKRKYPVLDRNLKKMKLTYSTLGMYISASNGLVYYAVL